VPSLSCRARFRKDCRSFPVVAAAEQVEQVAEGMPHGAAVHHNATFGKLVAPL
jgi:hypothetical protein